MSDKKEEEKIYTEESLRATIVKGSAWMVGMRWSIRGLGLISTLILVRLLTPDDFGVIASAMLIVGLLEVLTDNGIRQAIVRHKNPTDDHYHTAWTLKIIFSVVLFIIIFLIAPISSYFFKDERILPVIQIFSLRVFIMGFESIKVADFLRNFEFSNDYKFNFYKKMITFFIVLLFAIYLKNYWALVIGMTLGPIIQVALSFYMAPYKPRFSLMHVKEIMPYSSWMLFLSVGRFFDLNIDRYFVGYMFNTFSMGIYTVINEFAIQPVTELIMPLGRVLFPSFAKIQDDKKQLKKSFINVLSVIVIVSMSVGVGLSLVSENLILVALGEKWYSKENSMVLVFLALSGSVMLICHTVPIFLTAIGQARKTSMRIWSRLLFFLLLLLLAMSFISSLKEVAFLRLVSLLFLFPFYFRDLKEYIDIGFKDFFNIFWRPVIASLIMVTAVYSLPLYENKIIELILQCSVGASVFISTLFLLWLLVGRPSGPENAAFKQVKKYYVRYRPS